MLFKSPSIPMGWGYLDTADEFLCCVYMEGLNFYLRRGHLIRFLMTILNYFCDFCTGVLWVFLLKKHKICPKTIDICKKFFKFEINVSYLKMLLGMQTFMEKFQNIYIFIQSLKVSVFSPHDKTSVMS